MHRLEQFVSGILLPPISNLAAGKVKDTAWLAEIRSEVIESFLWLHLGVEIGSFPEKASKHVYGTYLLPFFESLLSRDKHLRNEMRSDRLYVAHSPESNALVLALPRYARILVEMAMRGDEVFIKEHSGFEQPSALQGLFQTLSLLHSSFVVSPAVRQFTYEVNFADPEGWEKEWSKNCSPDEVRAADAFGSGSPIALTLAGYLTFWGYGARWGELFQNFEGRRQVSFSDVFKLRDRISEIHSWRINLRSREASDRFEQVQKRIAEEVESETKTMRIDPKCFALFRESMESAFDLWGVRSPVPA